MNYCTQRNLNPFSGRDPSGQNRGHPPTGVPQVRPPRQLRHELLPAQRRGHIEQGGVSHSQEVRGAQVGLRPDCRVRRNVKNAILTLEYSLVQVEFCTCCLQIKMAAIKRQKIQEVLIHEIGHYFGFSDRQLYAIESEKKQEKKTRH